MDYKKRVDRVIEYIGKHLDEELELDELCRIACFSKYHFHRLFTAHAGVPLKTYIKWLRLKKAAYQLIVNKEDKIIDIALGAGFETHESFSRAFKQVCGQNPSEFRCDAHWNAWENPPYQINVKGDQYVPVAIKNLPSKRLAVMEHNGDPARLSDTFNKLFTWAKSQTIDLRLRPGEVFGFGYHDPREVAPEEFRFDLAICVPIGYKLDDQVIERTLPAGRYAVTVHKGSRDNIGDTINSLYCDWLQKSGEELGELPCVFCYTNFDHEVAETELLTEIRVLLKQ